MVCRHSCLRRDGPQTWAAEIGSDREMFGWWYHSVITSFAWREEEGVQRTVTQNDLCTVHISCALPKKAKSHFKEFNFCRIWVKTKPLALNIHSAVCARWYQAVIMFLLGLRFFHKEIYIFCLVLREWRWCYVPFGTVAKLIWPIYTHWVLSKRNRFQFV